MARRRGDDTRSEDNARAKRSAKWVAVEGAMVVGWVAVVPGSISAGLISAVVDDLPPYPTPVQVLARMATHKKLHGRGIGHLLLEQVFAIARTPRATSPTRWSAARSARPSAVVARAGS